MSPIIEIVVTPKGESTVQTKNFAGAGCMEASRFIETALGDAGKVQLTSEYFAAETASQQVSE